MAVGALLTCDDRVYQDMIVAGGRTPTGWGVYGVGGLGRRGFGLVGRMRR